MKIKNIYLSLVLIFTLWTSALAQSINIPIDTAVRIGKLDNGLTYYIRHNNWPENRVNFYIAQKVGSLQEEENQRGLAHFLEHMCFNGTKHFPGDALLRYCEGLGVKFGTDINAYTSIDETVYNINNVPTTRQSALDSCLLILRDWAGDLTLDPKEIDDERGVIHEEWRLRTGAMSRMLERNLEKLYPGSKYGRRFPIGLMSVVDSFKYKELEDYYHKWYCPNNQGIIIVGNIDVDYTEKQIKKLFSNLTNPKNAQPIVEVAVPDNEQPIVIIDKDKEQTSSIVQMMFKHDATPDSIKNELHYTIGEYIKNTAITMLNNRYSEAAEKADCQFITASADDSEYIYAKTKDAFGIYVIPKDIERSALSLQAIFSEALRAKQFGFTPTEYERAKANTLSALEKSYSNKDKRNNDDLANKIIRHFISLEPLPSIDYTYDVMKQVIPVIPLEAVNEVLKKLIPDNDSNLVIFSLNNEKEGNIYPTVESLLSAVTAARNERHEAFVDNVKNEPLIAKLPKAGKIKSIKENNQLNFKEVTLSNGITVTLKKTDFKADQVLMRGSVDGGQTLYGKDDYVNLSVFNRVIDGSGLGNFSSTELNKALAGKVANASLGMSELATHTSGTSSPKDVETMLQLTYLYFTNVRKDENSFNSMLETLRTSLKNRAISPDIAYSDSITATLYGHNPRLAPLTIADIEKINYDRILQIAKERTSSAKGWHFTIIGNFDEATLLPLLARYLGSLPTKSVNPKGKRSTIMQTGIINNDFVRKMETPKANATIIWHNPNMLCSLESTIKASMAGQILDMIYIKKIREEASAAYTVSTVGQQEINRDGFINTLLYVNCPMKPEKHKEAIQIMQNEAIQLSKACDTSMLTKVKEYMLKKADNDAKRNGYWLSILDTYYRHGIDLQTELKQTISKITEADICNFVADILKANNKIQVTMMPAE